MELNKGAAVNVLLDEVARTGGNPQIKSYLVELLGEYPVFTAVGKGEATLGDINLIRQISQRQTSPVAPDVRDMVIRALTSEYSALACSNGENPMASNGYRAALTAQNATQTTTEVLKVLFSTSGSSWRPEVQEPAQGWVHRHTPTKVGALAETAQPTLTSSPP